MKPTTSQMHGGHGLSVIGYRGKTNRKPKTAHRKSTAAFTLVEVAFASLIVCVVAFAVYGSLSRGIDIWRRVHAVFPQEDIALFFEKFSHDLENSFRYPDLRLAGNETYLSFPTFVRGPGPEAAAERIGMVRYVFDDARGEVQKTTLTYSEIHEEREGAFSPVLAQVEKCQFSYFFFNKDEEKYVWGPVWPPVDVETDGADFPLAVQVAVTWRDEKKTQDYTTAVFLPLA